MKLSVHPVITALIMLVGCVAGCGSPTKQFSRFISSAQAGLEGDKTFKQDYQLLNVKYDVKTTDSTVSPLVAEALVEVNFIPAYAEAQVRLFTAAEESPKKYEEAANFVKSILRIDAAAATKLIDEARQRVPPRAKRINLGIPEDSGLRRCKFVYAFQGGKWVLQASEILSEVPSLIVAGVPNVIKKYFAK